MERKIYAFKFYLILTLVAICLASVSIIFFTKAFTIHVHTAMYGALALVSGAFAAITFLIIKERDEYVAINFDKKTVRYSGYPVLPIHYYRKDGEKVASGEWGKEVFLPDAISVEVYKLSETERQNLKGVSVFNKQLKFNLVNGRQYYIPISTYSKRQIKELITAIQEINPAIQIKQS